MSQLAALTLLIWEENPEEVRLYLIPKDLSDKYREYLEQAHNKMINSDEMNDGMRFLNTALSDEECVDQGFEQYKGELAPYQYMHSGNPITGVNITKVYKSGFCL